jgi:hypothetical protein
MKSLITALRGVGVFLVARPGVVDASNVPLLAPTKRDGRHDFNFLLGRWTTHYRLLRHRLQNDNVWYDCDGKSEVRPFWDGAGNFEVGDLNCPPPRGHVDAITLRLYDAESHQWSLYFGSKKGGLGLPPQVGHFDANGVGDFFAADTFEGRPIVVRYRWSLLPGDRPHFEQAFSTDNGATWETNWTCDYTPVS